MTLPPSSKEKISRAVDNFKNDKIFLDTTKARDEVYAKFSPQFQTERMKSISEDTLKSFLDVKNNKHWTGLNRKSGSAFEKMDETRKSLFRLVDESHPISERLDSSNKNIKGLGKAALTAILHVAYPKSYGVWNETSVFALSWLGVEVKWGHGQTLGEKFKKFNDILLEASAFTMLDLWTLDTFFWTVREKISPKGYQTDSHNSGSSSKSTTKPVHNLKVGDKESCISEMKYSVIATTSNANGQSSHNIVKVKNLLMTETALDQLIRELLSDQKDRCAITSLPLQFSGEDKQMRPSVDRIDSEGHYSIDNLQIVCRFINFWKRDMPDNEFRRLLKIVKQKT